MKKKIVPGAEKQTKDHSVLAKKTRNPRNKKNTSESKGSNPPNEEKGSKKVCSNQTKKTLQNHAERKNQRSKSDDWLFEDLEVNLADLEVNQVETIMDQGYCQTTNSGDQLSYYEEHQIPLPPDEENDPGTNAGGGEECSKPKNVRKRKTSKVIAEPNKTESNTPLHKHKFF